MSRKKTSILAVQEKKTQGAPITMLTAYDYPTALALTAPELTAFSWAIRWAWWCWATTNTLPVTMDEMLHHCRAVARGAQRALPHRRYALHVVPGRHGRGGAQCRAIFAGGRHGGREAGGRARGGRDHPRHRAAGIPVMGHLGLTPQSLHKLGGFRPQAKSATAAQRLVEDAGTAWKRPAGCYALVLESIPDRVAELISHRLRIPTIGIGAGAGCDGQVLVRTTCWACSTASRPIRQTLRERCTPKCSVRLPTTGPRCNPPLPGGRARFLVGRVGLDRLAGSVGPECERTCGSEDVMRIAVLGTGALGCVFTAKLARCAEVWVLGTWTAGIDAIQQATGIAFISVTARRGKRMSKRRVILWRFRPAKSHCFS